MPTFLTPQQYIQFTKVHLYMKANSDQKRWLNFGWQHTLIICGWALEVKLKVQRYRKNICEYGIMRQRSSAKTCKNPTTHHFIFFLWMYQIFFSLLVVYIFCLFVVILLLVMVIIHHFVVPLCLLILMLSVCSHFGFFYGDFFITCLPVSPVPGRHI